MLKDGKNCFTLVSSLAPKSRLAVKRITHGTVTSGPFQAGETITGGSSKKTAVVDSVESSTTLIIHTDGGLTTGEGLTGGTSGATATMTGLPADCGHLGSSADLTNYNAANIVFSAGSIGAATTATPTIEESSDGSTGWAEIAAARLNGTLADLTANSTLVIGLTDIAGLTKTYVRPVLTIAGSNPVLCSAYVVRGEAKSEPAGSSATVLIG